MSWNSAIADVTLLVFRRPTVALLMLITGAATGFWIVAVILDQGVSNFNRALEIQSRLLDVRDKTDAQFDVLSRQVEQLAEYVYNEFEVPEDAAVAGEINYLTAEVGRLTEALGTIETAIVDSPERAMSIPILRRDIDSFKEDVDGDLLLIQAEVARIYDLGKWFLGLFVAALISVTSLAIKVYAQSSRTPNSSGA